MAEIVHLGRLRKARARREAEAVATANRAAFGRSKAEKAAAREAAARLERKLDGYKRER